MRLLRRQTCAIHGNAVASKAIVDTAQNMVTRFLHQEALCRNGKILMWDVIMTLFERFPKSNLDCARTEDLTLMVKKALKDRDVMLIDEDGVSY
jgi:hypothetical protein